MKTTKPLSRKSPARTCLICGAEYEPRRSFQKYCSVKCQHQACAPEWTCETCREPFWRHPPGPSSPKYCSLKCRDVPRRKRPERLVCAATDCMMVFEPQSRAQRYCSNDCSVRDRWGKAKDDPPTWRIKSKGEEACRNCGKPASHLHHIVPRSKSLDGKKDVAGNGLPLCFDCHRGWHDRRVTIPHGRLSDEELLAALGRTDVVWVSKNYPDTPIGELTMLYEVQTGTRLDPGDEQEALNARLERVGFQKEVAA